MRGDKFSGILLNFFWRFLGGKTTRVVMLGKKCKTAFISLFFSLLKGPKLLKIRTSIESGKGDTRFSIFNNSRVERAED